MKKQKLFALKNNTLDKWIKIGLFGKWKGHQNGTFELNATLFEQIVANFKSSTIDIVVDYEHATLSEPKAIASGWISKEPLHLKFEKEALWVKIDWTAQAKKHIENREYRYLSPVFVFETVDRQTSENIGATLHSVALTNTPFLEELDAVANKNKNQKEKTMEKELQQKLDEQKNINANQAVKIQELEAKIITLEEAAQKADEAASIATVEGAVANGKITQKEKAWALSYAKQDKEGFQTFLDSREATDKEELDLSGEAFANSQKPKATESKIDMSKV